MANKITKREVINTMLADEVINSNEMYVTYLTHELELLDKKAGTKRTPKNQEQNEEIKKAILEVLKDMSGTVSDIQHSSVELSEYSNQKLSAMLKQLCEEKLVVKTLEKKKPIFSLAR